MCFYMNLLFKNILMAKTRFMIHYNYACMHYYMHTYCMSVTLFSNHTYNCLLYVISVYVRV